LSSSILFGEKTYQSQALIIIALILTNILAIHELLTRTNIYLNFRIGYL
jgi:hypothetical protein